MSFEDDIEDRRRELIHEIGVVDINSKDFSDAYNEYKKIATSCIDRYFRVMQDDFTDEAEAYNYGILDDFFIENRDIEERINAERLAKIMELDEEFMIYCKTQTKESNSFSKVAYKIQLKHTDTVKAALKLV